MNTLSGASAARPKGTACSRCRNRRTKCTGSGAGDTPCPSCLSSALSRGADPASVACHYGPGGSCTEELVRSAISELHRVHFPYNSGRSEPGTSPCALADSHGPPHSATRRTRRSRSDSTEPADISSVAPSTSSTLSSSSAGRPKQPRVKKPRTTAPRVEKAPTQVIPPTPISSAPSCYPEVLPAADVVSAAVMALSTQTALPGQAIPVPSLAARRTPQLRLDMSLPSLSQKVQPVPIWAQANVYGAPSMSYGNYQSLHFQEDEDDIHSLRTPALSEAGDDDQDPFEAIDFETEVRADFSLGSGIDTVVACMTTASYQLTTFAPVDSNLSYSPKTPTDMTSTFSEDRVQEQNSWPPCDGFGTAVDYFSSNSASLLGGHFCGTTDAAGAKDRAGAWEGNTAAQQTWASLLEQTPLEQGWTTPEWYASGLSF